MKFFSFLLPLVLLLSFQIVSAVDTKSSIIGNWTSPLNITDVSPLCCIPDVIQVQSNGTDSYIATFYSPSMYEKGFSAKCGTLFLDLLGVGSMILSQDETDPDHYYSGIVILGGFKYDFQVQSGPSLNISIDSPYDFNQCNFIMETKIGAEDDSNALVFVMFFVIAFFGCVIWKVYQKKQSSVLLKQNLVQPAFNYQYNYPPQHYYMPPPPTNAQAGPNTTNNVVPVTAAPTNVQAQVPVAATDAKVEVKTNPEEQFLQDYPKFI